MGRQGAPLAPREKQVSKKAKILTMGTGSGDLWILLAEMGEGVEMAFFRREIGAELKRG